MKTINKKNYKNNGTFINLDVDYIPYDNLLYNHQKYLNKNQKYYIYCKKGVKSKRVTSILDAYGYDVTLVIE